MTIADDVTEAITLDKEKYDRIAARLILLGNEGPADEFSPGAQYGLTVYSTSRNPVRAVMMLTFTDGSLLTCPVSIS